MDDQARLQQQLAEIGERYLHRTHGELDTLRELSDGLLDPSAEPAPVLRQIAQLAHRICGSGAMFGFDELSTQARTIELLAGAEGADRPSWQRLRDAIETLADEVRRAARARNVE